MAKAARTIITKRGLKTDPVIDLARKCDALRQLREKVPASEGEKANEYTGAIDSFEGVMSHTPACTVEGAIVQIDVAIDTLIGPLFESIPVEARHAVFEHERKVKRLLKSVARVLRAQTGEALGDDLELIG